MDMTETEGNFEGKLTFLPKLAVLLPTDDSNFRRGRNVSFSFEVLIKAILFDEGNEGGGEAQSESDAELRDVEATHGDTLEQLVVSPNFFS